MMHGQSAHIVAPDGERSLILEQGDYSYDMHIFQARMNQTGCVELCKQLGMILYSATLLEIPHSFF
jgi:hypothetical protein